MKVKKLHSSEWPTFFEWSAKRGGLFTSPNWVEPFEGQIALFVVEGSGDWEAGFIAFEGGKKFAKTLITPPFTPNIGLFLDSDQRQGAKKLSHEKRIANAISDFLRHSEYVFFQLELPTDWSDTQPFLWSKYRVEVRYTYLLDVQQTDEELLQGMDAKLRNVLAKGEKEPWQVGLEKSESALLSLLLPHLRRKNVQHADLAVQLIKTNLHSDRVLQVVVRNDRNEEVYTAVFFRNNQRLYYLFGAKAESVSTNVLGPLGLWKAITSARECGISHLDFEGSMIPEVERFFRGFGGSLVPFYSVSGGKSIWPMLFRARYRRS